MSTPEAPLLSVRDLKVTFALDEVAIRAGRETGAWRLVRME